MLQIYLFGPTQEGFLDIDPQTVLQMESLSEAFDEDLSTGEFSLPVDLPWTANNRRLMGFSERLENFVKKEHYWRIIVYDNGFIELPNAKLTMLEKSGNFSYSKGKFSASVSGNKGLFGSLVKNKKLKDLYLGGPITWTSNRGSAFFAEELMKGLHLEYQYIQFAPVAIETFIDVNRHDYTDEFLVQDRVNNIIPAFTYTGDWTFANPTGSVGQYRTVPFFNLKFILKQIFLEHGYSLTGDFLDDADFDYLVIFNQFAIEKYIPGSPNDYNFTITPANHMPDMLVKDFLNAFFQLFNLYPDFSDGKKIKLVYKKILLTERTIFPLTSACDKNFNSQFDDTTGQDGYLLEYAFDDKDSFPGDRINNEILTEKTLVATVAKFTDLSTLSIGRQLTTDDIAFVEADNFYYQIADATATPLKWDAYAERMDGYKVGAGDNAISMSMSTLLTYVEYDPDNALFVKRNCVGCRQPGSYINSKGVLVKADFGLRIFYIKQLPNGIGTIPVSFSHNRDGNNNRILKYSLAMQGADGIAEQFHKTWQTMQQNREVVKTTITSNQKTLEDLRKNNCVEINNVLFLQYKTARTIPLKSNMEISLIPL